MEKEVVEVPTVSLPIEVVNKVLTYLGTRPYSEVAGLISAVQNNSEVSN